MKFLNSILHGNDVAEILIAGSSPYALNLLSHADVDGVRNQLDIGEKLEAYLVGRVVESGRGIWYLTSRSLVLDGMSSQGAFIKVGLAQVQAAECERGKYGYTVRFTAAGRRFALYGVAAALALAFFRVLGARVTPVRVDTRRAPALTPAELLRAVYCFSDAALRAQPLEALAANDVMDRVRQAGDLGLIDEAEAASIRELLGEQLAR